MQLPSCFTLLLLLVTPQQAHALQRDGATLIDIREPDEVAAGMAAGAVHRQRWTAGAAVAWLVVGAAWLQLPGTPTGTSRVGVIEPGTGAITELSGIENYSFS